MAALILVWMSALIALEGHHSLQLCIQHIEVAGPPSLVKGGKSGTRAPCWAYHAQLAVLRAADLQHMSGHQALAAAATAAGLCMITDPSLLIDYKAG